MHIHRYERAWAYFSIGLLIIFFFAVLTAALAAGVQLPSPQGNVDPADLAATDFAEPGLRQLGPQQYEVYMIGQLWSWQPSEITIPQGSKLTLYLTSRDVQHGFKVIDTTINLMVVPGQISRATHVFDTPGTYQIVCHEYCGLQHHTMAAKIIVEAAD